MSSEVRKEPCHELYLSIPSSPTVSLILESWPSKWDKNSKYFLRSGINPVPSGSLAVTHTLSTVCKLRVGVQYCSSLKYHSSFRTHTVKMHSSSCCRVTQKGTSIMIELDLTVDMKKTTKLNRESLTTFHAPWFWPKPRSLWEVLGVIAIERAMM